METYKISILPLLLVLLSLTGYSDRKKLSEDEQYERMAHIINDDSNIYGLVYNLNSKDGNTRNLSVACGGTGSTEGPVIISLTEDTVLLGEYNYTNFIEDYSRCALRMDPKDHTIEGSVVTYPTGEPYALVPIEIDISIIESLDPDKIYFVPIVVTDTTPCPIVREKGNTLLQTQKKNRYTSSTEPASHNVSGYKSSEYFIITKTMVPLTKNRVRINIGTKRLPVEPENRPDFIKKNTIVIEVADDNSLAIEPYSPEEMEVETVGIRVAHPGDNAYALYNNRFDPTAMTFCVYYRYRLKIGSWTKVWGTIHLLVIVIEQTGRMETH